MAAAPLRLLPVLVAAALTLSACGQTSKDSSGDFQGDQKVVAQTIEDLQKQSSKQNPGEKICTDLLAADLVAKIKTASKQSCADALDDAFRDADSFELQVKKVSISGTTATATVESDDKGSKKTTDTLTLTKSGDGWKISSLGSAAS
jgi:outer membrane PBP1 activator LpoA protein